MNNLGDAPALFKAYVVTSLSSHSCSEDFSAMAVVYAASKGKAKAVAWGVDEFGFGADYCVWTDLRVKRAPDLDAHAIRPGLETSMEVLRPLGFRWDDDQLCEECGEYFSDPSHDDEWPICSPECLALGQERPEGDT